MRALAQRAALLVVVFLVLMVLLLELVKLLLPYLIGIAFLWFVWELIFGRRPR